MYPPNIGFTFIFAYFFTVIQRRLKKLKNVAKYKK